MKNKIIALSIVGLLLLTGLTAMSAVGEDEEAEREESVFITCFVAGTKITMADGSKKNIEDIEKGELVKSYNTKTDEISSWKVDLLGNPVFGENFRIYNVNNGLLELTEDHPLRVKKQDGTIGWGSMKPKNTHVRLVERILQIEVGDQLFTEDGEWIEVTSIEFNAVELVPCYNILSYSGKQTYYANGILAFEEHPYFFPFMLKYYLYQFCKDRAILRHFKNIFLFDYE